MGTRQQKFKARMQKKSPKTCQIHPQPTNVKEQLAASSGKETQSVQSKLLPPKTAPCDPRRELQFSNNPDPTNSFLSPPTTKCACGHRPRFRRPRLQSRPPPALTSQSMTKEPTQHTKFDQILLRAMFAQMMSNWKHCEDQQKKNIFQLCQEHWCEKQF